MVDNAPDPGFLDKWGVGPLDKATEPDPNTRMVDDRKFSAKWLADIPRPAPKVTDTNSWWSAGNAASGEFLNSIPIVGPYIKAGGDRMGAAALHMMYGVPYDKALAFAQKAHNEATQAHPALSTGGEFGGAIAPMVALGGVPAAARALGMTGTLGARTAAGLGSNALIGGADAAVRSGGDVQSIMKGAAISGILGGAAPIAGQAIGAGARIALRPAQDAMTRRLLTVAAEHDIPIGASQVSTSPFVRKVSQIAGQFPGSGQNAFQGEQVNRFTRAVSRTFGEDAENLTPQIMQSARRRLGNEFDHVANNTTITVDHPFVNDLTRIAQEAETVPGMPSLRGQFQNILSTVDENGHIGGESYQALTRKGTPLDRAMQSPDPNVKYYASQIREALDDAMHRSATPEMAQRLSEARRQYKNLMTVAPLVVKGAPGEVSPLALQSRVNSSFKNRAFSGGGELGDLADLGQAFFRRPADSGTPLGSLVVDQMMRHGNALAAGGLAALTGGGYLAGYDPVDILKTTGGLAAAGLLARGSTSILNRPQTLNALASRVPYLLPYATGGARQITGPQEPSRQ